jgi:hypothetical protein
VYIVKKKRYISFNTTKEYNNSTRLPLYVPVAVVAYHEEKRYISFNTTKEYNNSTRLPLYVPVAVGVYHEAKR